MQSCLCLILVENHSCALFDWLTVSKRSPDEKERRYIWGPIRERPCGHGSPEAAAGVRLTREGGVGGPEHKA